MNLDEVRAFFDAYAPKWDEEMIRNEYAINTILHYSGLYPGCSVLDVACGTGVLVPDYQKRGVGRIVGIDISPWMLRIAKEKFQQDGVEFVCADAAEYDAGERFDSIVVYNAFPHFVDKEKLIAHLASMLKPDGILTVAHGMGRDLIDAHHSGAARAVSSRLMPVKELAAIFARHLTVETMISTPEMYQVAGRRQSRLSI